MIGVLLVGVGSFIGGVLRYGLSAWVYKVLDSPWFPYGTLAVNAAGCLVIGFLSGLAEARAAFTPETRLFLFVGILGGFTTFPLLLSKLLLWLGKHRVLPRSPISVCNWFSVC